MLTKVGVASVDELFRDVPESAREPRFALPAHAGEMEVERALARLAAQNSAAGSGPFFCGAGAYRHYVPATVDHLIQRSEFLTSYTPYQPEIAQGTLQVLFEFQTQVALITRMEVANAAMDGRGYRRGRRPIAGQWAEFRRPLCRAVFDAREIPAPDAGPACRSNCGCRRAARLRSDAFGARTAYPPRKGDEQYLYQFRPLCA